MPATVALEPTSKADQDEPPPLAADEEQQQQQQPLISTSIGNVKAVAMKARSSSATAATKSHPSHSSVAKLLYPSYRELHSFGKWVLFRSKNRVRLPRFCFLGNPMMVFC